MRGVFALSSLLALAAAEAERTLEAGACAGARSVRFRFVHVPKSGGMTLTCSFDLGYRAGLPPCRALERAAAANILGFQHLCGQLSEICGSRTAADAALYAGKLDGYRDTRASESAACYSYASLRKVA